MKNLLVTLCLLVGSNALGVNALGATNEASPGDVVHRFIDSFNAGDVKAAAATHVSAPSIIDEVPPYLWQGRDAFETWLRDLEKHDSAAGVTGGNVKLGKSVREEVDGDRAYVVMACDYTFKQNGTPMHEPSQMTFALNKEHDGWRIAGWTFAGPKPTP